MFFYAPDRCGCVSGAASGRLSCATAESQSRLRSFRTGRLAHHLFDDQPTDLPRFDDLDAALADFASEFVRAAVLAVEGHDRDLGREEETKWKMDKNFGEWLFQPPSSPTNEIPFAG